MTYADAAALSLGLASLLAALGLLCTARRAFYRSLSRG
jgi:hypothetical protein